MTDSQRSLWAVSFHSPPDPFLPDVEAVPVDGEARLAYSRGELRSSCIILARDRADALDFGRQLQATWRVLELFTAPSSDARAEARGRRSAFEELAAFLRSEKELWGHAPTSAEWIGRVAELEKLATWCQARMPERCPDTERPRS